MVSSLELGCLALTGKFNSWYHAIMNQQDFENTLRDHLRRRPFFPFFIEMADGSRIEVDAPNSVAMGGGAAGYVNARGEPTFFNCENVRRIVVASAEAAS